MKYFSRNHTINPVETGIVTSANDFPPSTTPRKITKYLSNNCALAWEFVTI
jgi:hypothetical protein